MSVNVPFGMPVGFVTASVEVPPLRFRPSAFDTTRSGADGAEDPVRSNLRVAPDEARLRLGVVNDVDPVSLLTVNVPPLATANPPAEVPGFTFSVPAETVVIPVWLRAPVR